MRTEIACRTNGANVLFKENKGYKSDRDLKQNLETLKKCRKDFKNLSEWLIKTLDLPVNGNKRRLIKFFSKIIPKRGLEVLPESVALWIAEETNAADMAHGMLRENINNVQEVVQNLAVSAIHEEEKLKNFAEDIKKAEEESWDIRELQQYLCEQTNLPVPQGVEDLLDGHYDILSLEQKEEKRSELLNRLKNNAVGRKRLIEAHGKVCALGLEVWHAGVCQYFDYVTIMQPLKVISEAAQGMADMNAVAYAAKEIVKKYLELSSETLANVAEATSKIHEYAVSAPDTMELMENVTKKLGGHIRKIEDAQKKITALDIKKAKVLDITAHEIEESEKENGE